MLKHYGVLIAQYGMCCLLSAWACGGPVIVFNDNGGWCWYQDERVIVQNGKLIIGSVGNSAGTSGSTRSGDVEVTTYNIAAGSAVRTTLHDNFQGDDHDGTAFLAMPDGRVLAMYTKHLSDYLIHVRITTNAYDTTVWGSDVQLTRGASTSYSNLFRLSSENGGSGRIYDFYRGENYNPNFIISDDNGATWSYGGWLIRKDGQRPYAKYTSNNTDKIYVVCSNAHPREYYNGGFGGTGIYAGYVYQGGLYKLDGTKIQDISTSAATAPETLTQVYAGDSTHRAWPNDVHLGADGNLYIAFSVQVASSGTYDGSDLRYFYARWDGSQVHTYPLAYAGSALYSAENDYAGLACIDPQHPSIVYVSANVYPTTGAALISNTDGMRHYEIFRGTTTDGGSTWTWEYITRDSTVDNIRPIVPIWDNPQTILLWMRGSYSTYTSYNMQIVGKFDPEAITSDAPEISVQPNPASAPVGGTAVFEVQATGLSPLTYTWYKKNSGQVGGDSYKLVVANIQPSDFGKYYCVISNSAGSATSVSASLMNAVMKAYWPLDGNYNDVTGNGYDAAAVGSLAFTSGHLGQSVSFNGSSYLNCQNSGDLTLKDGGTVSAWVKTSALNTAWASIVSKGQFGWRLSRNSQTNAISFRLNSSIDEYQANGNIPVVDGAWHHLAATYDTQSIKLYVDGQLDTQVPTPQSVNESMDTMNIGSQPVTSNTVVYVDATATNTALANGSGNPWWAAGTSTTDFLWDYRTDYGLNDAGQFNVTGRDVYQAREDTCGQLVTTITGLTPGNQYRIDVAYYSKSSSEDWNITTSFAPITTDASGTVTSGITYSWDGAVIYGVHTVAGVNTGNVQGGIYLMTGFVGNATADANGQIKVYIGEITNEAGANQRTWYDGLYVKNVSSNPSPAMFWDGLIDDVRIYSFAMDSQTVGLLYEDKSCYQLNPYDLNKDCRIGIEDLVLFSADWLNSGIDPETQVCVANPEMDITGPKGLPDCKVDLFDYTDLASRWLECYMIPSSNCP